MSVVINDLEVVPEAPATPVADEAGAAPEAPAMVPVLPLDLRAILRREARRRARCRAH